MNVHFKEGGVVEWFRHRVRNRVSEGWNQQNIVPSLLLLRVVGSVSGSAD